jgi:hypothetical protein
VVEAGGGGEEIDRFMLGIILQIIYL